MTADTMTSAQVAEYLGIARSTLSRWRSKGKFLADGRNGIRDYYYHRDRVETLKEELDAELQSMIRQLA